MKVKNIILLGLLIILSITLTRTISLCTTNNIKTSFIEEDKRKATFEEVVDTSWTEKWKYDTDYDYYMINKILYSGTPSLFNDGLKKKITNTYLIRVLK